MQEKFLLIVIFPFIRAKGFRTSIEDNALGGDE
jgi:hypothetical protein